MNVMSITNMFLSFLIRFQFDVMAEELSPKFNLLSSRMPLICHARSLVTTLVGHSVYVNIHHCETQQRPDEHQCLLQDTTFLYCMIEHTNRNENKWDK